MPDKEPNAIFKLSDSSRLIREFLARAGEIYGREITPELAAIWEEFFGHLPREKLSNVLWQVLAESKFFPTLGHVTELLKESESQKESLQAERAWNQIADRREIMQCICDGIERPLDSSAEYAVRVTGGWKRFCNAFQEGRNGLAFLKKDFLGSYNYFNETHALQVPSREEALKLIGQLGRKQLPHAGGLHGETIKTDA